MSLYLLAFEHMAFWLVLTAFVTAASVHVRHGVLRWLAVLPPLLILTIAAIGSGAVWQMAKANLTLAFPFEFATFFLCITLVAALGVVVRGWSRDRAGVRRAESWRVGTLAVASGAILLAHGMTFWNADMSMRQQVETLRVEAGLVASSLAPVTVPEPQNAAIVYQETMLLSQYEKRQKEWDDWSELASNQPEKLPVDDPKLLSYLRRRSTQLERVREATKLPVCNFRRDWARLSVDMLLPETQALRQIALDLRLSAFVAAAQGRKADALRDIVAMHRLADHAAQEPILVSLLVGTAIDHIAVKSLEHVLSSGGEAWTETDLRPLDDWHSRPIRMRFQSALRMEEAFGVATFCQIMNGDADARMLQSNPSSVNVLGGPVAPFYRMCFFPEEVRSHRQLMRHAQNRALAPELTAADNERWFKSEMDTSRLGVMSRLLVPALQQVFTAMHRSEAMQRLAILAIELVEYRQAHGAYPESLESLESDILLPLDPFSNAPLKMLRRDNRIILYSVGPDAIDNQAEGDDFKFTLP